VIEPQDERARPGTDEAFGDAVTFAFGDEESGLFATARIGFAPAAGTLSALAVVFAGNEPVAALARGDIEAGDVDWQAAEADGVRATIEEPLRRWSVGFDGDGAGFSAHFEALTEPMEFGADSPAARVGGVQGYEQLCGVEAEVTAGGETRSLRCLGQREHSWGAPRWDDIARAATVSAWLAPDRAIALRTVRPAGAEGHEDEAVSAVLVDADPADPDAGPQAHAVAEPRLSTTYDGEGHQRRAGLELWVGEEDQLPRRAGGRALCGTTLELGRLRLDSAFFAWRMEGRAGVGRYDVLRRADA
jgi:hypothetical protein